MNKEMIVVLDFGGQYNQLIARRVRECNVYCEVWPYTMGIEEIKAMEPKGIISPAGRTVCIWKNRRIFRRRFLSWGFRFWGSAMARS